MKLTLVTYATPEFEGNRDRLVLSAKRAGFAKVVALGPEDLVATDFWRRNQAVLTLPRGGGYWLWKPYIIRMVLRECYADDVLVYSDAGPDEYYSFSALPVRVARLALSSPMGFLLGTTTPQHGTMRAWTKRDCLVLCGGDRPEIYERPQIQATWSIWTKTDLALRFLDDWLAACEDPRCLTDIPNQCGLPDHDGFIDHRHDQAIASVLAAVRGVPGLDVARLRYAWGYSALLRRFQGSEASHRFQKRLGNIELLLAGVPAAALFLKELLRMRLRRAWKGRQ